MRVWVSISIVVVGGMAMGCGKSEEDRVRDRITGFVEAIDDRLPTQACEMLTDNAREEIVGPLGYEEDCPDELRQPASGAANLAIGVEVGEVRIEGDSAIADVEEGGDTSQVRLEREGDEWLIDSFQ